MSYSGVLNLARSAFKSRAVRTAIGERIIDITATTEPPDSGGGGGIGGVLSTIWGGFKKLVGFLLRIVDVIGWIINNLWDIIVTSSIELFNFDWNQTDQQIKEQINQNNLQIVSSLGTLFGTSLVWIVSIGTAAGLTVKFPVLAGSIALRLAEEGSEEIRAQFISFLSTLKQSVIRNSLLSTVLNARRLRWFGQRPITTPREPWTIAGAIEEKIQSIPNDVIRTFIQSALDAAVDSIIEVGYVVSYTIGDFYKSSRSATQSALGQNRIVRIIPDKRVDGESIVLAGNQKLIEQSIQTTIATHRMIYNRDVGQVVGQPVEDWLRGGTQLRKLTIVFRNKKEPPWRSPDGERMRDVTLTIPEPRPGLSWTEIKAAANSWTWGKFRCTAQLKQGRQMAVYGATAGEAETKLREIMRLSTLDLIQLSCTEELDRHPRRRKEPTRMYPCYAILLVRRSTAELVGLTDLEGNTYRDDRVRIELWPDTEPPNLPPIL